MKRLYLLLTFLLLLLPLSAQRLLKHPLTYVPADSVFVLPRGESNIIMDVMAVDFRLAPQSITISRTDRKAVRKGEVTDEKLLLLTGHASYATSLEESYFNILPQAIHDEGILPYSERRAAAQRILDLTGTIFALGEKKDVYLNFFENCCARINNGVLRLTMDVISEYPDGPQVKLRMGGLPSGTTPFTLHIRVPEWAIMPKFHINGHEIIRPVIQDGYLVIDRKWRNNEEVFFYLHPKTH